MKLHCSGVHVCECTVVVMHVCECTVVVCMFVVVHAALWWCA